MRVNKLLLPKSIFMIHLRFDKVSELKHSNLLFRSKKAISSKGSNKRIRFPISVKRITAPTCMANMFYHSCPDLISVNVALNRLFIFVFIDDGTTESIFE